MGLERMSFLLPMYGMLHNISPQSCDMGLGSNSDAGLSVAHTCEVSTLFEEEGEGGTGEEAAEFRLEDTSPVELPGPLSCPMESVGSETQDDEMAQSAHLMSLGLCRISSIKCLPRARTLEPRPASAPRGQEDAPLEEKLPRPALADVQKPSGAKALSCILCHVDLASRSLLEVHLKCHDGERRFRCPRCGWAVEAWPEMERHWRGHGKRRGGRPHRCQECPRTFRSASTRDAHQQRHARRGEAETRCASSPDWCQSEQERELHTRCHVQGGFKCLHCGFTDESWDEVHKHMISQHKHTDDQQAHLDQHKPCNMKSRTEALSDPLHIQATETGAEDRRGHRKRRARRKMRGGLQGGAGGRCTEGEEPRGTGRTRGRKEFCCSLCDRKFSTKLTMRRHMGIHQGDKPYLCPHCHYSTRLKASLVQHLRVHTGEKPFKCSQCPYASIDSSSLRRHARTHTQEKPHCCQLCSYSSIQKKSLDLHVRRHHTGESFPCHLCRYTTPDRQLLLRHLRKHHPAGPPLPSARKPRPHGPFPAEPAAAVLSLRLSPLRHSESPSS
ncbi:zinc finger protein 467 [Megalops cyprinoides]|uniref:zinc finger protein 467 n=1 Tax=Megalops cyprinoides TaxID=118141 RepID=UPI001863BB9A|nr:zinc finger protein 467 [Megalops cyprinoides]